MNKQMADLLLQAAQDPRVQRAAVQGARAAGRGVQQLANRPRRRAPRAAQRRAQAPFNRRMVQRAPVAISRQMGSTTSGRTTRGREFVADVLGSSSSTPAVVTYKLNPGNSTTFPRLSQEANVFEQYRFRKLRAIYTPAVSTATAGTITMTPEYNAIQTPPTTEQGLLNHQGSKSGSPWAEMEIILSPAGMHGNASKKYIRAGPVQGDLNSFDAGQLHVSGINNGGTGVMGKLWLEYEVEFFIPQIDTVAPIARRATLRLNSGVQSLATGVEEPIEFQNASVDGLEIPYAAGVFTPPVGAYIVYVEITGKDDFAEQCTYQMRFRKNGSNFMGTSMIITDSNAQTRRMHQVGFISCNGTDEFWASIEMTAGAGNLTLLSAECQCLFLSV